MFIGHFAVGLAAKRASPRISLGSLFLAAQLLDLIWPALVLAGVERVRVEPGATAVTPLDFEYYPWSHSLVMTLGWAIALGLVVRWAKRSTVDATLVGLVVLSHWVLDWFTHRADLPLWPTGTTKVGLGLWNSVPGSLLVEVSLFAAGVWIYARTTRALDRQGQWGFWSLVAFLAIVHAANLTSHPPPDLSGSALAGPALAMWLLVVWGYWVDRHRETVTGTGMSVVRRLTPTKAASRA
jgi:hypothetical protein